MTLAHRRLYVGNLPIDVTEEKLKKKFSKFGISSAEIKQRDCATGKTVFGFINIPDETVDAFLNKFHNKPWNGSIITVQVAKENFLDRLKRERLEAKNGNAQIQQQNQIFASDRTEEIVIKKGKHVIFSDNDENVVSNISCKTEENFVKKPKKKQLMESFKGMNYYSSNCENNNKEIASSNFDSTKSGNDVKCDNKVDSPAVMKKIELCEVNNANKNYNNLEKRECVSDQKRRKALEDRWKVIMRNKKAVQCALKSTKVLPGRIVKFDSLQSEITDSTKKPDVVCEDHKKIRLFDESDSDGDDYSAKFKVYDGKEGLQFMKLKTRVGADERFKLDERFLGTDPKKEIKGEEENTERKKQLDILTSIVGQGQIPEDHRNEKKIDKPIIRFDPSNPQHKKYEKRAASKDSSEMQPPKKNKRKTKDWEQQQHQLPVKTVQDDAKFYKVSTEKLKHVFGNAEDKPAFSLAELFQSNVTKQEEKQPLNEEIIESTKLSPKKKPRRNINSDMSEIFGKREDSSSGEEESEENMKADAHVSTQNEGKVLGSCGVWRETLFFRDKDPRFDDAREFFSIKKDKKVDFSAERRKLKIIVRKKLRNNQRDRKMFKNKLGGSSIKKLKMKMRIRRLNR